MIIFSKFKSLPYRNMRLYGIWVLPLPLRDFCMSSPAKRRRRFRMVVSARSCCVVLRSLISNIILSVRSLRWKPINTPYENNRWCSVRSSAKCTRPSVHVTPLLRSEFPHHPRPVLSMRTFKANQVVAIWNSSRFENILLRAHCGGRIHGSQTS